MPDRPSRDLPLKPSVLDRLLDDEPHVAVETPRSQTQVVRELRQSVRRDLENLLNTRWRCTAWPPDLDQLDDSLLNYGIPDFTAMDVFADDDPRVLLKAIERAVRNFEPRLKDVRIEPIGNVDQIDRNFRFRLDAILHVEPISDPVRYDSSLEPSTGRFQVEGGGR